MAGDLPHNGPKFCKCRRRRIVKLLPLFMELSYLQQHKVIARKRNQKRKGIDSNDDAAIDKLSDCILINILSRMSLKEAARTCVLARRWKYLWRSVFGTLEFEYEDFVTADGDVMDVEKFECWVNTVLELHQGRYIEGMVISFEGMQEHYDMTRRLSHSIDNWMCFAVQKEVQRLELNLSPNDGYKFPSIEMLISHSYAVRFSRLKVLSLVHVQIEDEVVLHFLASAPILEELCVRNSRVTKNLKVVDPPSLRVLEISECRKIQSLELSAVNLVSLTYGGGKNSLLLKEVPNLRELTISDDFAVSYVLEPKQQSCYSSQLVKLVLDLKSPTYIQPIVPPHLPLLSSLKRLEVQAYSAIGHSLLFFTLLIEESPQLSEFRIEMSYSTLHWLLTRKRIAFPAVSAAEAVKFDHKSLKVVEMAGFVGCRNEEVLLLELVKNAPLIERVVIDTESEYYDDTEWESYIPFDSCGVWAETGARTQSESKERAKRLASTFPHQIQFIVT